MMNEQDFNFGKNLTYGPDLFFVDNHKKYARDNGLLVSSICWDSDTGWLYMFDESDRDGEALDFIYPELQELFINYKCHNMYATSNVIELEYYNPNKDCFPDKKVIEDCLELLKDQQNVTFEYDTRSLDHSSQTLMLKPV